MATTDGGSAFPTVVAKHWSEFTDKQNLHQPEFYSVSIGGVSLRDYFAGQALLAVTVGDHVDGEGDPERHAALAYKYADAMLKERVK